MNEAKCQTQPANLMIALERLEYRLSQLRDLSDLTDRMNQKLNRTENDPTCESPTAEKQDAPHGNIVELFYNVADSMDKQINIIGNNTERSMEMID